MEQTKDPIEQIAQSPVLKQQESSVVIIARILMRSIGRLCVVVSSGFLLVPRCNQFNIPGVDWLSNWTENTPFHISSTMLMTTLMLVLCALSALADPFAQILLLPFLLYQQEWGVACCLLTVILRDMAHLKEVNVDIEDAIDKQKL